MTTCWLQRVFETHIRLFSSVQPNLRSALVLAEQQGNSDFKVLVEKWLQRLDQVILKRGNHKQSRRGGQWKGKVKIADDFGELPESFMEVFRRDNE